MNRNAPSVSKRLPRVCLWIYILTAVSALIYLIFTQSAAFSEFWNNTVGAFLRRIFAYLLVWLPFSGAEILILMMPVILVVLTVFGAKNYCDSNRSLLVYLGIISSGLCVVGIIFVWSFAAGYYAKPLDEKLSISRAPSTVSELSSTADLLSDELDGLVDEITFLPDGSSVMPYSIGEMNAKILDAYDALQEKQAFVQTFYSRVKPVMLSEAMSYTHITGVYSFFTGEANLNVNFPDYTLPFTTAHELAHQRGIAREDEANFVAFLVCAESDDPYIRYSGYLSLYEYVSVALATSDYASYKVSYANLPSEVRGERRAYLNFFEKYRDNVAATVSETTNNAYLQSQGASEGTQSYGLVVDLAVAYYRPVIREQ